MAKVDRLICSSDYIDQVEVVNALRGQSITWSKHYVARTLHVLSITWS